MRKVISILCLGLTLAFVSCENWLDVQPKSEIKWDMMFETEQGFKDALLGCYAGLSEKSVYGAELSCGFVEALAQQYYAELETSNDYQLAFKYMYTSAPFTKYTDAIWAKLYNVLANVNSLIEAVETKEGVLNPTTRALIKAEAYSLRAYVYLDLVRLFTWGNLGERPDREAKLAGVSIPYAKTYDKDIIPQETLGKVLQYMHDDLETAIALFYDYSPDSKKGNRPDDYTKPSDEEKFYDVTKTKYRMNLRAAIATRMRLYMWEGNYDEAYKDSRTLQSTEYPLTWISMAELPADVTQQDLTFAKEMIFGLEAHERFDKVINVYFRRKTENGLNDNSQFLSLPEDRASEIYERDKGIATADWRYIYWWGEKAETSYVFYKFREVDKMKNVNNIPLLKSAEVCYTEAECLLRKGGDGNKVKAIEALNRVRNNRGLSSMELKTTLSQEDAWEELTKEWRKEFMGDGQMFFYYKRTGSTSIPYTSGTADDKVYVLPLPQQEVDFGGREDLIPRKK